MGELIDLLATASEKLGTPPELLSGLPTMEISGDCAMMLEQHRGIVSYSDTEVRIAVNIGCISVCGCNLLIRVMNQQKIILCGRIETVRIERLVHDKN